MPKSIKNYVNEQIKRSRRKIISYFLIKIVPQIIYQLIYVASPLYFKNINWFLKKSKNKQNTGFF